MVTCNKSKYPRFTKEEEKNLCARLWMGDDEARELLFFSCFSLALKQVGSRNRLLGAKWSLEEVNSIAGESLLEAVDHFDCRKGRLTTLTYIYVMKVSNERFRERTTILLPHNLSFRRKMYNESSEETREAVDRVLDHTISSGINIVERGSCTPFEKMVDSDEIKLLYEVLDTKLSPRNKQIVLYVADGKTYEQIASIYKITKQRVEQIYKNSIKKIKSGVTKSRLLLNFCQRKEE